MILTALSELADREGLVNLNLYEWGEITFAIHLDVGGRFLNVTDLRQPPAAEPGKAPGKPRAARRLIPRRSGRTVKDQPELLVDKAEYLFGVDPTFDPGKRKGDAKLASRRSLFREMVDEVAAALPENEGLQAVVAFLGHEDLPTEVRELLTAEGDGEAAALAGALFAFVYEPDGVGFVHDAPAIKAWWRSRNEAAQATRGQCLVTGKVDVPLTTLHASPRGIPPMSATKGGVPLTTTNADSSKSYGLSDIGCAPISREANLAIEAALTRLLDPAFPDPRDPGEKLPARSVKLTPDTALLFWSPEPAALEFIPGLQDEDRDPAEVAAMVRSPWKGRPAAIEDPSAFYALVISGAQGRATVRSFVQSTVRDVATHVDNYLLEAEVPLPGGESGVLPLPLIHRAIAARQELDRLPPGLGSQHWLAILTGRAYPRALLEAAVRRSRVDPLPTDSKGHILPKLVAARASLLRAFFIRNHHKEITVPLDPEQPDPAYRLGRLLALLDKMQQEALGGDINATLVDRYYGSASSTPAAVFPTLIRRSQHHLARLRRDKRGLAIVRERLLQEIVSPLHSFAPTLTLENQGLFALGFFHQRHDLWTKKDDALNTEALEEETT